QPRYDRTRHASPLTGDVTVTKRAITPGFDFAAYVAGSSQSVVVPPATSPLYRVKLDVHVLTAPDLQMQTAIARLSGDADLHLRGTVPKPPLLGRVEIREAEINATVSNRVQKLLGVSKIKVDPQGLNTETNPTRGPQVTIEQQIVNNFTLTYSQNVSQASQQIIQGEYYVRKNVSIVGTRDQNGV